MSEHKTLTTTSGRKVHIFDNVLTNEQQVNLFHYACTSAYRFGSTGTGTFFEKVGNGLMCRLSEEELKNSLFLDYLDSSIGNALVTREYVLERYWILASTYLTSYTLHSDTPFYGTNERNTILYYANLNWDANWNGETLFANDKKEVELAVPYKPNRAVIFDSSIPHKPTQISVDADPIRFTWVVQLATKII